MGWCWQDKETKWIHSNVRKNKQASYAETIRTILQVGQRLKCATQVGQGNETDCNGEKKWLNGIVVGEQRSKLDHNGAEMLFKSFLAVGHVPICAPQQQPHYCYFDSWTSVVSSWTAGSPRSPSLP